MTTRCINRWLYMLTAATLLVPVAFGTSSAQQVNSLQPGTRVRVMAPSIAERPLIGTVALYPAPDTLALTRGVAIPLVAIEQLEISRGRKSHWIMGALMGAGIGAALGVSAGAEETGELGAGPAMVIGGVGLGLLGLLVGGLVGNAIPAEPERWEHYPLQPPVGR